MVSVYKAELPRQSSYSLQLKLFLPWALSSRLMRESLLMSSVGQSLSSQWVMSVLGLIDENMAPVNSRGLIRNLLVCVHDPLLPCKEVMTIQPPTFHTIHLSWAPQNISNWIWDTQKPRPVASESVLVLFSSFSSWTLSSSWTWFLPVVAGWRRNGESHACLCEASWQGPGQNMLWKWYDDSHVGPKWLLSTDYQGCISIDLSNVRCPASANDRLQTKRHGPIRVRSCCPSLPVSLGSQGRVKRPRTGLRETGLVRDDTLQLIIAGNVNTSAQNGPNIMNKGKLK